MRSGWLNRQFDNVSKNISEWPTWMKCAAGFVEAPAPSQPTGVITNGTIASISDKVTLYPIPGTNGNGYTSDPPQAAQPVASPENDMATQSLGLKKMDNGKWAITRGNAYYSGPYSTKRDAEDHICALINPITAQPVASPTPEEIARQDLMARYQSCQSPVEAEILWQKIEAYNFECEGGPLRNCVEWQQLREALAAQSEAREKAEARVRELEQTHRGCFECEMKMAALAASLRDVQEKSQAFLSRVKELEPHIDSAIVLHSVRAGTDTWRYGNWVKERDELSAILTRLSTESEKEQQ